MIDGLSMTGSTEVADRRNTRSSKMLHASRIWLVLCELAFSLSS